MAEEVDPIDAVEIPEESEAPEGQAEEQSRDEKGQYAEAEDKSQEAQEAPETPDTTDTEGGVQVVEPVPWQYRADQRDYSMGMVGDDGVVSISPQDVPHLEQLLASGRHWADQRPRERADFQQQVDTARAETQASDAARQKLFSEIERAAGLDADGRTDWAEALAAKWPELQAAADTASAEARNSAVVAENEQYRRNEQERALQPRVVASLEDEIHKACDPKNGDARFRSFSFEDKKAVYDRLAPNWRGLMVTDQSLPWQGEGTPWLDKPQMFRELEYIADLRGRQTKQEGTTEAAAKSNAAELSKTKAPPAVKATTTTTSASSPAKRFKPSKGATAETVTEEVDAFFDAMEV